MFKCGRVGGWTGSILIISISSILNVHETIRNNFPPAVLHWKHLEMFNQDWLGDWDWTLYHLLYGAVFRNLFAISIALLIYNCHVSESDPFNKILSLKLWMPLSSISYSVYLIHVVPITFTFLLDQFPMTYTDKWHIAFHYLVQLSLSIAIGFIVTMSVEIPFRNLERIFSKKKIHLE
uniref:Acyltransferase 3 domain-containing protein n=1 Tax=Acrobeloides nanus TaxID=290746 RepID=A0A914DD94_9BILA